MLWRSKIAQKEIPVSTQCFLVIGKAFCEIRKVPVNNTKGGEFTSAKTPLEKSPAGKDVAKKIISAVNSKENTMDEIRNFYADVKNSTGRPRTHHDRYLHIFTQTSGFLLVIA